MKKKDSIWKQKIFLLLTVFVVGLQNMMAQGAAGIDAASSEIATYIDPISNLIMIIGGVVGFIGAVRVYIKWNNGDQDVQKSLMGWIGSCVFLVISGAVIKAFFGV